VVTSLDLTRVNLSIQNFGGDFWTIIGTSDEGEANNKAM